MPNERGRIEAQLGGVRLFFEQLVDDQLIETVNGACVWRCYTEPQMLIEARALMCRTRSDSDGDGGTPVDECLLDCTTSTLVWNSMYALLFLMALGVLVLVLAAAWVCYSCWMWRKVAITGAIKRSADYDMESGGGGGGFHYDSTRVYDGRSYHTANMYQYLAMGGAHGNHAT